MHRKRSEIKVYADRDVYYRVKDIADKRGSSISAVASELISTALEDSEESTRPIKQEIFDQLASLETRVAKTLTSQGNRLDEALMELTLLKRMLDRFASSYFAHTKEVPAPEHGADRRYELWQKAILKSERTDA